MTRTCSVCTHEAHPEIDAALLASTPNRAIARQYGLTHYAVGRHVAAHLGPQTVEANCAKERDILSEIERLLRRLDGALDRAEEHKGDRMLLLATRENRGMLELLARMDPTRQDLLFSDRESLRAADLAKRTHVYKGRRLHWRR
jgi:hypothetical protein